jgi:hypothetical protein
LPFSGGNFFQFPDGHTVSHETGSRDVLNLTPLLAVRILVPLGIIASRLIQWLLSYGLSSPVTILSVALLGLSLVMFAAYLALAGAAELATSATKPNSATSPRRRTSTAARGPSSATVSTLRRRPRASTGATRGCATTPTPRGCRRIRPGLVVVVASCPVRRAVHGLVP